MDHPSSHPPEVPPALVARHMAGWREFTRISAAHIVAVAALLIFLLLVFRVF